MCRAHAFQCRNIECCTPNSHKRSRLITDCIVLQRFTKLELNISLLNYHFVLCSLTECGDGRKFTQSYNYQAKVQSKFHAYKLQRKQKQEGPSKPTNATNMTDDGSSTYFYMSCGLSTMSVLSRCLVEPEC